MLKVKVIKEESQLKFENEVEAFIRKNKVLEIKFAVTPDIHSSGYSSYSAGQVYYAMFVYE